MMSKVLVYSIRPFLLESVFSATRSDSCKSIRKKEASSLDTVKLGQEATTCFHNMVASEPCLGTYIRCVGNFKANWGGKCNGKQCKPWWFLSLMNHCHGKL